MPKKLPPLSQKTFIGLGLIAAGLLAFVVLFAFDPARSPIYPVCLFHKFTGLHCPGCGSLRALHQLTHGNFAAAFHHNALLVSALPLLALGLVRQQSGRRAARSGARSLARPATAWLIAAIVILFTVLRNVPAPAFAWMSP